MRRLATVAWVLAIALSTYAGIWWQTDFTRFRPGNEFVQAQWHKGVEAGSSVQLDPSATRVAVSTPAGLVRILDDDGHILAQRQESGPTSVALTGPGNLAALYHLQGPDADRITFIRLDGSPIRQFQVEGAVTDAAVSLDGSRAACATAAGILYSFDLAGRTSFHFWHSTGSARQVYLTPDGALLLVATADPPDVWAYLPEGKLLWKLPNGEPKGACRLFPGPDGRFVACLAMIPPRANGAAAPAGQGDNASYSRFVVTSVAGRQQWGARLRADDIAIALSNDGRSAAITYVRPGPAGTAANPPAERKVVLFGAGGEMSVPREVWQHGGPFYDPRLVAIAPDASFVATHDGERSLCFFGPEGQLLWRHKMAAPILSAQAGGDGGSLLVLCRDDTLTFLRAAKRE